MSDEAAKVGLTTDQCCCLVAAKWIISVWNHKSVTSIKERRFASDQGHVMHGLKNMCECK